MTVSSTTNRKTYAGDSVTTSFGTSPVVFFDTSNLVVSVVDDTAGTITTLVEGTKYTVSGGAGSTGTVSLAGGTAPHGVLVTGTTLVILRIMPLTQVVDLVNNDANDAEVMEDALDKLTMIAQQLDEAAGGGRSIRLSSSETGTSGLTVLPFDRANKYLSFDANKNLVASATITTVTAPVSAFMETVLDDTTAGAALTTLGVSTFAKTILDDANSNAVLGTLTSTRAESGAQANTVLAKLRETISAYDFMTAAQIADAQARTLTLDLTTALQAAINATAGKRLYIPAGSYKYSLLTVTNNNTMIHGDGRGTRLITNASAGGVTFDIGDGVSEIRNIELRDVTFWASVAQTAQACIRARKIVRSSFKDVYVGTLEDYNADGHMLYDGIVVIEFGSLSITGGNIISSHDGLVVYGNSAQTFGAEFFLGDGYRIVNCGRYGIHIAGGAGGVKLDDVDVSACADGLHVSDDLGGAYNREIFIGSKASFDSCTGYGMEFDANSCVYVECDGTWSAGNLIGVNVEAAQPTGATFKFSDMRVYGNTSHGVYLNDGHVNLGSCQITNNGTGGGGGNGIYRAGSSEALIINGCYVANNGAGATGNGIEIAVGADNFVIANNICLGNTSTNLSNNAGTGATKVVANNIAP